jgi:hypothetical protein
MKLHFEMAKLAFYVILRETPLQVMDEFGMGSPKAYWEEEAFYKTHV